MEHIVELCDEKMAGVLNGLDVVGFDPATDPAIYANYTPEDTSGKEICKAELQRQLGLQEDPDAPVVAMVSRLVSHKGVDLVCDVLDGIMDTGAQLVVLGKGDYVYEEFFKHAQERYPGRLSAQITYSDKLSRQIYSGADLFLMPSKSEPCGLSQMIAMRYGTLPIVRETGGLKDSVQAYEAWRDTGNGFSFSNYNSSDMLHVIREAVELYSANPEAFARLRQRAMECDFSWARSADAYLRIYEGITGQLRGAVTAEASEKKPAKKAAAKKTTTKKAPAEKKTTAKKTTKKAKAEEVPAETAAEEKPVKKTTRKKTVKAEEAAVETVAEEKPVKKTTRKKTTKKETPAEETAEK